MINNKVFDHRPISELMAIVKNDLRRFDQEGLIDEGTLIKTVMYCNDKLGLTIREIREVVIPVEDNKAELPEDFEKLYYVSALKCSNSSMTTLVNPFDNNFDQTVIHEACLDRESLGCVDNYQVVIKREGTPVTFAYNSWTQLSAVGSDSFFHSDCPNRRKPGKYQVHIKDGKIHTPFRSGMLYLMYVGMMKDEDGNITFPFHPMITPYYEYMLREKILSDIMFNSDTTNVGELFKLAQQERVKAWIDAFNFTTDKGYGEYVNYQRKKELGWYNQYFKFFQ